MEIRAKRLKELEIPTRTRLYEVGHTRDITVEERHTDDGSLEQVVLGYIVEEGDVGYFANEYRPDDVPRTGAKVIDITSVMVNHIEECARWHLYDIKRTLARGETAVKLCNQWNCGLRYLQQNILAQFPGYSVRPDLGVITRSYDKEKMEDFRDEYKKRCHEIENAPQNMTLPQRKRRTRIAEERAVWKASQAILDGYFQAENGNGTYEIHIRKLVHENDEVYKMKLLV